MMSMVTGYWVTQIVAAAAAFNLAEHFSAGPLSPERVAEAESADLLATRRLLRACASLGLLATHDGRRYEATPLLGTLRKDSRMSLHYLARSQAAPGHWLAWGRFPEAVRAGTTKVAEAHGTDLFSYFEQQPEEAMMFTASMQNLSLFAASAVAESLDVKGVGLALDVGGADGELIRSVMEANPELKGGVYDLPHVVPDAVKAADAGGLADRFTAIGGDFFEEVPPADMYLLKYVLHDWNDEQCVRILSNCRASLAGGGRVVIVEQLIGEPGEPDPTTLMDMNMLAMCDGRERDLKEFDTLLQAAGLRRKNMTPAGNMAIIEAVAAD
jgi:hypothetical protein